MGTCELPKASQDTLPTVLTEPTVSKYQHRCWFIAYSIFSVKFLTSTTKKFKTLASFWFTRIDVYETLCPQHMLVHKGGKIKNWGGECRDVTPTKSLSQNIRVDVNREVKFL